MNKLITLFGLLIVLHPGAVAGLGPGSIKAAYNFEHDGVMFHQEYLRLDSISYKIESGGTVTDGDLVFAVGLIKTNAPNLKETTARHQQAAAMSVFDYSRWTPHQKDMLLKTAVWLIHQPTPTGDVVAPEGNKEAAIFLLGAVNDKRALPYLHLMGSDPDPEVAKLAAVSYARVYKSNSGAPKARRASVGKNKGQD